MKKIIKPSQQEESVYYSDFSGYLLDQFGPPVQLKINFNYGSKYDDSTLELDLTDEEVLPLLKLIASKLSEEKRKELLIAAEKIEPLIESSIEARDWESSDIYYNAYHNNMSLYNLLLDKQ